MKKLLGVLMTLSSLMFITACTSGGSTADAASSGDSSRGDLNAPIRIGFFAPESAVAAATDGQNACQFAELAVKIVNDVDGVNGCKLELMAYDDSLDNTQAANIAEKLSTADKMDTVVSDSYSGPTRVATPIFQDTEIVIVAVYAIHPDMINTGDFIFSQFFPGSVQGTAGAEFAVGNLEAKEIAIIGVDLDFGKEPLKYFRSYAEANGVKTVSEDYVAMSDNNFISIISKIESLNVDMIYSTNYYAHASEVVRQTALQGLKVPVLGAEGTDSWQLLRTAGEYADGLYITTDMNRDDKLENTQKYIEEYEAACKIRPDMVDAPIYDTFQVLFAGFEPVDTGDSAALRDYISSMEDFETVTGKLLYYTKPRLTVKTAQIQQMQGGTFHGFAVIDDSEIIDPTDYQTEIAPINQNGERGVANRGGASFL